MKRTRGLLLILFAAVLTLCFAAPAFAAGNVVEVLHDGTSFTPYNSFAQGWQNAVGESNTANTTVRLLTNWEAIAGGSFGNNTDGFKSGAILVPANKTVTIDMNGWSIDRKLGQESARADGCVIYCEGNLSIINTDKNKQSIITGGNSTGDGGGLYVSGGGNADITGVSINNNTAVNGGGVFISGNGKFTMHSGVIQGNNATEKHGGVCVNETYGTFAMEGGKIIENSCGNSTANGGSGGVYCGGNFELQGNVQIIGNTANNEANNVYLSSSWIKLTGALTNSAAFDSLIGITSLNEPESENPIEISHEFDADMSEYFYYDNESRGFAIYYNKVNKMLTLTSDAVSIHPLWPESGGQITPAYARIYAKGQDVTFAITPNEGYVIDDVLIATDTNLSEFRSVKNDLKPSEGYSTYTFENVRTNCKIKAKFTPASAREYTAALNSVDGVYTIEPAGEKKARAGETVAFKVTPASGYAVNKVMYFAAGSETGVAVTAYSSGNYSFAMPAYNVIVKVTCEKCGELFTIVASAGEGGEIGPSGSVKVKAGYSQPFVITPADGYQIKQVVIDGIVAAKKYTSYTFENVTANHTISVTFERINSAPTTSSSVIGIDLSGMKTVNENAGHFVKDLKKVNPDMTSGTVYQNGTKLVFNLNKLEDGFTIPLDADFQQLTNSDIDTLELNKKRISVDISVDTLKKEKPEKLNIIIGGGDLTIPIGTTGFEVRGEKLNVSINGVTELKSATLPVQYDSDYIVNDRVRLPVRLKNNEKVVTLSADEIIQGGVTVIQNERTLVPQDAANQRFGVVAKWDPDTQTATFENN